MENNIIQNFRGENIDISAFVDLLYENMDPHELNEMLRKIHDRLALLLLKEGQSDADDTSLIGDLQNFMEFIRKIKVVASLHVNFSAETTTPLPATPHNKISYHGK